jgi:hypothetical protein
MNEPNSKYALPPIRCRTLGEALDEVQRELEVRERLYPRWLEQGRITKSDAVDRHHRLATALLVLRAAVDNMGSESIPKPPPSETELVTSSGDSTERPF